MSLTSIQDRLTPSVPVEITYGAQSAAVGRKVTTIFAHKASSGGSALPYEVYDVQNVGDAALAKAEVDAKGGTGSQAGFMAEAFVLANTAAGRSNYPAFRIVFLAFGLADFGPADEALEAVKFLRSDMFVSCFPASATALATKLKDLCALLSGPDRDLNGQFGSFVTIGSIDALSSAIVYAFNSKYILVAYLQDTNTEIIDTTVTTTTGSKDLTNPTVVVGIYPGATVVGAGIPANTYVVSVEAGKITLSQNATATADDIDLVIGNHVSQSAEIVAAAHAGALMASPFPYAPVQSVAVGGLVAPQKRSDWIAIDPNGKSEVALTGGLSPLTVLPGQVVAFIRTRTTFTTLTGNIPAKSYIDWQDIVTLNDFREVCYGVAQNPPFNNNPGGTKASVEIAAKLKDEVLREAKLFETSGAFQFVSELAKLFQVQVSTTSRGRFDFKIPVDVVPGLFVIAGNIQGSIASELLPELNFTV